MGDLAETKQILFVLGVGRSGTTAIADLLNAHPAICLGIERFKLRFLRDGAFTGDEFERDRFFRFEAADTNILPEVYSNWRALYAEMALKFDAATIVGDKIPHLFQRLDACDAAFPEAKWIYMLRGVAGVASSWNRRAMGAEDKWPASHDYRAAVQVWNRANTTIKARLARFGPRMHVLCYEDFFSGNPVAMAALLDFLELDAAAAFQARAAACFAQYEASVLDRPRVMLEGQAAYLAQRANLATYRDLLRASGRTRPVLARADPGVDQGGTRPQRSAAATA